MQHWPHILRCSQANDQSAAVLGLQHVRAQYQTALPALQALLAAYPQHITPEQLCEARFLWAVDLWYSYAMEARFHPSSVQQRLSACPDGGYF